MHKNSDMQQILISYRNYSTANNNILLGSMVSVGYGELRDIELLVEDVELLV